MLPSDWTFTWALALWKLVFCIFWYIVTIALLLMTRLTKVGITPTKPLCYWATKFAFKFYKVVSMFWTIIDRNITASRTNKLFRIISLNILCIIHDFGAIFPTSKIWFLAFKAHKICINSHRILFWFVKIRRVFIC